jgi:hypothetical protein
MSDLEFTVACWLIQAVAYTPIWLPGLLAGWGMYAIGRSRLRRRAARKAANDKAWVDYLDQEARRELCERIWAIDAHDYIGDEEGR